MRSSQTVEREGKLTIEVVAVVVEEVLPSARCALRRLPA
jgi:hypothetical protein